MPNAAKSIPIRFRGKRKGDDRCGFILSDDDGRIREYVFRSRSRRSGNRQSFEASSGGTVLVLDLQRILQEGDVAGPISPEVGQRFEN